MTAREVTETIEEKRIEHIPVKMPYGLLGFESIKDFFLVSDPEENPFMWLQMAADVEEAQSFLVVSPFVIHPGYSPDFSEEEMQAIGVSHAEDAMLLNIVTLRGPNHATVNLKGPLVINRQTLTGKQIIPENAGEFQVDYPIQTGAPTH
jgi:flagellar assembly factor FliW